MQLTMKAKRNNGFTLVEILIVVVIMAVLAATIIPQFSDSAQDAKANTALFNLHTLRSQIELYKSQHDGKTPDTLLLLTKETDRTGAEVAGGPYGPYIHEIPANPLKEPTVANLEKAITAPPAAGSADNTAGWLYFKDKGQVWINHNDYLTE
jgi:prepilin-type N-terminal cleavage/methylation domain-containing protein